MSDQEQWAYSRDGERFTGGYSDWREAAEDAIGEGEFQSVYVGKCEPPRPPEHYLIGCHVVEDIIEHIQQQDDYCHEFAEDWPNASQEQIVELGVAIRDMFRVWLDKFDLRPKFFSVPHSVIVTKADLDDPEFDPFEEQTK